MLQYDIFNKAIYLSIVISNLTIFAQKQKVKMTIRHTDVLCSDLVLQDLVEKVMKNYLSKKTYFYMALPA